jgi:hypothetical protein
MLNICKRQNGAFKRLPLTPIEIQKVMQLCSFREVPQSLAIFRNCSNFATEFAKKLSEPKWASDCPTSVHII